MKAFTATKRDNQRGVMRVELSGDDVETLEALIERVDILAKIEDTLSVVAIQSPFIIGNDVPTVTKEGADLLRQIVAGWENDEASVERSPTVDITQEDVARWEETLNEMENRLSDPLADFDATEPPLRAVRNLHRTLVDLKNALGD